MIVNNIEKCKSVDKPENCRNLKLKNTETQEMDMMLYHKFLKNLLKMI